MLLTLLIGEMFGLILFFFAAKDQYVIGLRSFAYLIYGYRTWSYSNKLFGLSLIILSSSYLLLFLFFKDNFTFLFKSYLLFALLSIVWTDLSSIRKYRKQLG